MKRFWLNCAYEIAFVKYENLTMRSNEKSKVKWHMSEKIPQGLYIIWPSLVNVALIVLEIFNFESSAAETSETGTGTGTEGTAIIRPSTYKCPLSGSLNYFLFKTTDTKIFKKNDSKGQHTVRYVPYLGLPLEKIHSENKKLNFVYLGFTKWITIF